MCESHLVFASEYIISQIILCKLCYLYPKQSSKYCKNGGNTMVPIALPDMHKPFANPRSFSKYCVTM